VSQTTSKILGKNNLLGSKHWLDSADKTFFEIASEYFIKPWWGKYSLVKEKGYSSQVLMPVNPYVIFFNEKPALKIEKGKAKIIQKTYSDIYFLLNTLPENVDAFYILDKATLRQFYPSNLEVKIPKDCFPHVFRFYTPWFINRDIEAKISSVNDVFNIYTEKVEFKQKNIHEEYIDTEFIHFSVKKNSRYLIEENVGLIEKGTEVYSIEVDNEELIEELIKEYDEKRI